MHYHLEIVLPSDTLDIESAVESILNPFDENNDSEEYSISNAFWDFYVIGGRWAGTKLMAKYDKEKISAFYKWMEDEKITVSGFTCGKQTLSPASNIPKVDAKWNEMFPPLDGNNISCPIFSHSNDQYGKDGNGTIIGDICKLSEAMNIECSRIIFTGHSYESSTGNHTGKLEAKFMLSDDFWNGVNHLKTTWDGKVSTAVDMCINNYKNYLDEYKERITPNNDWIIVTVDYHS